MSDGFYREFPSSDYDRWLTTDPDERDEVTPCMGCSHPYEAHEFQYDLSGELQTTCTVTECPCSDYNPWEPTDEDCEDPDQDSGSLFGE